ncbi:MAG: septum formation protein Maf [Firmicutes bacterium]|nr:septum formation protein Maf [Bacillota bacterium]
MARKDIVLASASPRRMEMFQKRGIDAQIHPAKIDESLPFDMPPETAVMYLSFAKASHVADQRQGLIIAADTIVVYDGQIIGKPRDEEEAFRILSVLRNREHQVITGVCLIDNAKDPAEKMCFYDVTDVYFGDYSDEELGAYVRTPEPYDKAGGYAIQETFGKYIDHIEGDLDNVIGFPMYRVEDYLK